MKLPTRRNVAAAAAPAWGKAAVFFFVFLAGAAAAEDGDNGNKSNSDSNCHDHVNHPFLIYEDLVGKSSSIDGRTCEWAQLKDTARRCSKLAHEAFQTKQQFKEELPYFERHVFDFCPFTCGLCDESAEPPLHEGIAVTDSSYGLDHLNLPLTDDLDLDEQEQGDGVIVEEEDLDDEDEIDTAGEIIEEEDLNVNMEDEIDNDIDLDEQEQENSEITKEDENLDDSMDDEIDTADTANRIDAPVVALTSAAAEKEKTNKSPSYYWILTVIIILSLFAAYMMAAVVVFYRRRSRYNTKHSVNHRSHFHRSKTKQLQRQREQQQSFIDKKKKEDSSSSQKTQQTGAWSSLAAFSITESINAGRNIYNNIAPLRRGSAHSNASTLDGMSAHTWSENVAFDDLQLSERHISTSALPLPEDDDDDDEFGL